MIIVQILSVSGDELARFDIETGIAFDVVDRRPELDRAAADYRKVDVSLSVEDFVFQNKEWLLRVPKYVPVSFVSLAFTDSAPAGGGDRLLRSDRPDARERDRPDADLAVSAGREAMSFGSLIRAEASSQDAGFKKPVCVSVTRSVTPRVATTNDEYLPGGMGDSVRRMNWGLPELLFIVREWLLSSCGETDERSGTGNPTKGAESSDDSSDDSSDEGTGNSVSCRRADIPRDWRGDSLFSAICSNWFSRKTTWDEKTFRVFDKKTYTHSWDEDALSSYSWEKETCASSWCDMLVTLRFWDDFLEEDLDKLKKDILSVEYYWVELRAVGGHRRVGRNFVRVVEHSGRFLKEEHFRGFDGAKKLEEQCHYLRDGRLGGNLRESTRLVGMV